MRAVIAPRVLDVAGREEHVRSVERSIRMIKERVRCICHSLPYKRNTKIMVRSLVESVVFWLNSFPASRRILVRLPLFKEDNIQIALATRFFLEHMLLFMRVPQTTCTNAGSVVLRFVKRTVQGVTVL